MKTFFEQSQNLFKENKKKEAAELSNKGFLN
jgi:hypothetical protein